MLMVEGSSSSSLDLRRLLLRNFFFSVMNGLAMVARGCQLSIHYIRSQPWYSKSRFVTSHGKVQISPRLFLPLSSLCDTLSPLHCLYCHSAVKSVHACVPLPALGWGVLFNVSRKAVGVAWPLSVRSSVRPSASTCDDGEESRRFRV
jgi:hypothetical protein